MKELLLVGLSLLEISAVVDEGEEEASGLGGEGTPSSSCRGLTMVPSDRSTTGNGSWEWTFSSLMLDSALLMASRD